jgi:hypothetical protein
MSTILVDGNTTVVWVTTISDPSAPTATEIDAGEQIQSFLTQDGLDISQDQNMVDVSVLNSLSELADFGRSKVDTTLTLFRKEVDTAWTEFADNPYGFLVVRRGVLNTTAFAAADLVEVYPSKASNRMQTKPASNEAETFTVKLALVSDYQVEATVAS